MVNPIEPFLVTINREAAQGVGIMFFKLKMVKFSAMNDCTRHEVGKNPNLGILISGH